jgi:hypothetical protein
MRQLLNTAQKQTENMESFYEKEAQRRVSERAWRAAQVAYESPQVDAVRLAYEEKLNQLEQKLAAITTRTQAHAAERAQIQKQADEYAKGCENSARGVCAQQEVHYIQTLTKYRVVVENMRKREAIAQESLHDQVQRIGTLGAFSLIA